MLGKTYLVVGDEYKDLATQDGVLLFSEAMHRLDMARSNTALRLVVGQGLCREQLTQLKDRVTQFPESSVAAAREPAPLALTHKHESENVLISTPVCAGNQLYRAEMLLDDRADRLSDHVTGMHIGGMLLVEAARQLVIAALESEYGGTGVKLGLLWSDLNVRFVAYAFPVPTDLILTIQEDATQQRPGQVGALVVVEVVQAGQLIADVRLRVVSVRDAQSLSRLEAKRAQSMIQNVLGAYTPPARSDLASLSTGSD